MQPAGKNRIIVLLILVNLIAVQTVYGSNAGITGGQILNIYTSARLAAMGNAGVGLADDVNGLAYNPAGLTQIFGTQLQFTHIFYYAGTRLDSVSGAKKFGKSFSKGVVKVLKKVIGKKLKRRQVRRLEEKFTEELNRIGLGFKWKFFHARDKARDEYGIESESFNVKFSHLSFGGGYALTEHHSLGLAVNFVTENIYDEKGKAVGIDLAWHYKSNLDQYYSSTLGTPEEIEKLFTFMVPSKINNIGVVIKNLGSRIRIGSGSKNSQPLKLIVGGAHELEVLNDLLAVWEVFTSKEVSLGVKCGMEKRISLGMLGEFKARAGFIYLTNPNITLGFGIPERNWYIDYAFLLQELGAAHRFSYGVKF